MQLNFKQAVWFQSSKYPPPSDRLLKERETGWLNLRSKAEAGLRNKPVALLDQQLLHKTGLDQSMLISCRLWALNSATSHSSHKRLWCKVNSIDNYCSAWIPRPPLYNLEVALLQRRLKGFKRQFLDIVLINPNFKPDNYFLYQKTKLNQCKNLNEFI